MTREELDRLESLLAKATPGPWKVSGHGDYEDYGGNAWVILDADFAERIAVVLGYNESPWRDTALLIAALRNAAPALLAAARDAESQAAELARLRAENMCDVCTGTGKPISNIPCMCGGTGKMSDAAVYLREEVARLRAETDRLYAERRRDALDGQAALDESNNEVVRLRAELSALTALLARVIPCIEQHWPHSPLLADLTALAQEPPV